MDVVEKCLRIYRTRDGQEPFTIWLRCLKDERARQRIQARLGRVRLGNLGYPEPVGQGVLELKLDFGPGYRIYFGQEGNQIVVLLCGGDKSSQSEDIKKARAFWEDYKAGKNYADY
jgi:putative addiction module killer protein